MIYCSEPKIICEWLDINQCKGPFIIYRHGAGDLRLMGATYFHFQKPVKSIFHEFCAKIRIKKIDKKLFVKIFLGGKLIFGGLGY